MPISIFLLTPAVYLLAIVLWCLLAGNPFIYMFIPAPAGQSLYLISKLLGMLAVTGIGWQAVAGLLSVFSQNTDRTSTLHWHRINGTITVALALGHILSFVTAVSIRSNHFAYKVFLPDFSSWYQTHVFIGVIAFLLLLITVLRPLLNWKKVIRGFERGWHALAILAFPLILWHALSIGSETRNTLMLLLFSMLSLLIIWALILRLQQIIKGRKS